MVLFTCVQVGMLGPTVRAGALRSKTWRMTLWRTWRFAASSVEQSSGLRPMTSNGFRPWPGSYMEPFVVSDILETAWSVSELNREKPFDRTAYNEELSWRRIVRIS